MLDLERCCGGFNTLDDPSDKVCIPNEMKDST